MPAACAAAAWRCRTLADAGARPAVVRAVPSRASRALAGVTGGLFLVGCGTPPAASGMAPDRARGAPARSTVAVERTVPLDLSLDALLDRTPPPIRIERNIFRFGSSPDHDPEAPRARAVASRARAAPPAASAPASPPPAAERAPTIGFIGVVEARARRQRAAVLADERGIHHGHVGAVVAVPLPGRCRRREVGPTQRPDAWYPHDAAAQRERPLAVRDGRRREDPRRGRGVAVVVLASLILASGCAAGQAFRSGETRGPRRRLGRRGRLPLSHAADRPRSLLSVTSAAVASGGRQACGLHAAAQPP